MQTPTKLSGNRLQTRWIRSLQAIAQAGRARRKDRQIGAAFALHLELAVEDRIADLVVADRGPRRRRRILAMRFDLRLSPLFMLLGSRGVVAVAVDDHRV